MLRVGLTGGLASGKSLVGATLAGLGCYLIQADELGHKVLLPGGEAYDAVVNEFGEVILDDEGMIDRRRLAALVFDQPERLQKLNSLVHPPVIRREQEIEQDIARRDPHAIAVVEAAILVETGSYKRFDKLIVAACTAQQQLERQRLRHPAARADRLRRRLDLGTRAGDERHMRAGLRQRRRCRQSDPAPAAGDQRALAVEAEGGR